MKLVRILIAALFLAPFSASAGVVDCNTTLLTGTLTETGNGSVIALPKNPNGTVFAVATYNSGTSATLDMKVQTCRTDSASTCADTGQSFDQCGTTTCYSDGFQGIDFSTSNLLSYARISYTLAGTNPNYTVTVYYCAGGR